MERRINGIVDKEAVLEDYLRNVMGLTRRQISQAKFRKNGICINHVQSRSNAIIGKGDFVEVLLEEVATGSSHLVPCLGKLKILYEDRDILVVNKPAGVVVHPSHGHYQDSLSNMVVYYYAEQGIQMKIRSVGRLDKETSGIMVFAKNQVVAARLSKQKRSGIYQKEYLALTYGVPPKDADTIVKPMAKDRLSLMKMKVCKEGMMAVTHYRVLQACGEFAAVSVKPETGRTHQIRLHMASIGHPLIGDQLYGSADCKIARTALHAWKTVFHQPFTDEAISIEAEVPEDMKIIVNDIFNRDLNSFVMPRR